MNKYLYIIMLIFGLVSCAKIEPEVFQIQSVAEPTDKIILSQNPYENWVGVSDNGTIWVWGDTDIFSLKDGNIKRFPANDMHNYTYPSMGLLDSKVYYDSGNGLLSVIENDSTAYYYNADFSNAHYYAPNPNFLPLEKGMLMSHYEPYDEYYSYASYSTYFDGAQWKKPNMSANMSRYGFAYGSYITNPVVVFNEATFSRKSFTVSLGNSNVRQYDFNSQSISKTGKLYFYNYDDYTLKFSLVELDALTGNITTSAIEIPDYSLLQVYSVNVDSEDNVFILAYANNNEGLTMLLYNYTTNNVVFKNNTLTDGYGTKYQCFSQKNGTTWLIQHQNQSSSISQLVNNELIHSEQLVGTEIGVLKEDDDETFWFGTWPNNYESNLFCIDLISFKNENYTRYWPYFYNPQGEQIAYQ